MNIYEFMSIYEFMEAMSRLSALQSATPNDKTTVQHRFTFSVQCDSDISVRFFELDQANLAQNKITIVIEERISLAI